MIGPLGHSRGRSGPRLMAEINITPFTDVVLVLLIVFMVSASFLGVGNTNALNVSLPAARAAEAVPKQDLDVSVRKDGSVYIGRDRISLKDLPGAIQARHRAKPIDMVIVQADERVLYERIVQVMDAVKLAGLDRIALATRK
jgi:biopolymer transport protein ExbD